MKPIFQLSIAPILQNKVYGSQADAQNCPVGVVAISQDPHTGLVQNAAFDPALMTYDLDYDNSVPSETFLAYYDSIADYLVNKYNVAAGTVLDIGCGKGTFLKRMAARYPQLSGVGIDPSYEGEQSVYGGRLKFIPEYLDSSQMEAIPNVDLVICRHTLEHIPNPVAFVTQVFEDLHAKVQGNGLPFFFEVPDLDWILANKSFWDFCYEHVNYFTAASFANALTASGASDVLVTAAFNGQYLWAEGVLRAASGEHKPTTLPASSVSGADFDSIIADVFSELASLPANVKTVIWGMATKGVLYALYLKQNNIPVDYCVDINTNKQGKYAPVTGLQIIAPSSLPKRENLLVFVMNPNYAGEIKEFCFQQGINASFVDPLLNPL